LTAASAAESWRAAIARSFDFAQDRLRPVPTQVPTVGLFVIVADKPVPVRGRRPTSDARRLMADA